MLFLFLGTGIAMQHMVDVQREIQSQQLNTVRFLNGHVYWF